jgi:hypothetical protein
MKGVEHIKRKPDMERFNMKKVVEMEVRKQY